MSVSMSLFYNFVKWKIGDRIYLKLFALLWDHETLEELKFYIFSAVVKGVYEN